MTRDPVTSGRKVLLVFVILFVAALAGGALLAAWVRRRAG
jgi:hypothetical protein